MQGVVEVWIDNLNEYTNVNNKMTYQQIEQTASMIFKKYYYLTLDEIALVFFRGKTGFYGDIFRLDGMIIMKWFNEYDKERIENAERLALDEHYTKKGSTDRTSSIKREAIKHKEAFKQWKEKKDPKKE